MKLPLLLAVVVVAAGCVAPDAGPVVPGATLDAPGAVVRHTSSALLPPDASAPVVTARLVDTGFLSTEPTVGVTSSGVLFTVAGGPAIGRSRDGGATWEVVGDPVTGPKRSFDPWVLVDPRTDRVFNGPLYVVCSWMEWSDDDGETWAFNPVAGCGFPGHDYQKISTGPAPEGVQTDGYDGVVYYVYSGSAVDAGDAELKGGTHVSRSLDGGRTFGLSAHVHAVDACGGGFGAPISVAPDGVAYSTRPRCDGADVARSRDAGLTWESVGAVSYPEIPNLPHADANIAIDELGRLLMTTVGGDGIRFATSVDEGSTWSDNRRLAPPGVLSAAFGVNAAGAAGRFAVAYLGTDSDPATWPSVDPSDAPDDVVWHLYLATTEDAFAADPVWTTTRLTPEDDPVQRGCIWLKGFTTGETPCRNLGDFISIATLDGRVFVSYTDGCDRCESADTSRERDVRIAIVETGPSLLGGALAPFVVGVVNEVSGEPRVGLGALASSA